MSDTNNNDNIKILVSGDSISKGVIYDETRNRYVCCKKIM